MPRRWEIVGGGDKGGLLVREGRSFVSQQLSERLATGAIVEELELVGERLQFRLITGTGPPTGWISSVTKGKELAKLLEESPASKSSSPKNSQTPSLTREQAWALQEELLKAYEREDFQRRLQERWLSAGGDLVQRAKVRQEVCLEVQGPILQKYGFEASRKGVALSVNEFRKPELAKDAELTARNQRLGWLADPGQRQENQSQQQVATPAQKQGPAAARNPSPGNLSQGEVHVMELTREQALAMQEELLAAYMKPDFQQRLGDAWKQAGDNMAKKTQARQQVCLEVQGPIVAKYGFDASLGGVMASLMSFSAPHLAHDEEVLQRTSHMLFLVNPDEQERHRKYGTVKVWLAQDAASAAAVVSVNLSHSVRMLKEELQATVGTAWHTQRLWLGDTELEDHWHLGSFISDGATVDLLFQPRREEVARWLQLVTSGPETRERARCLQEVPAELLADCELALPLVSVCRWALSYLADSLRQDRRVVETALRHSGGALEYAASSLQAERELVLLAVTGEHGDAWALQFAASELRGDREVVRKAVIKDGWALQFASESMLADREIVLLAARREGWVLSSVSRDLQRDREVVLTAVKQNWQVLETVSAALRADREVVLAAVKQDGWALEFAATSLQADKEIVLVAVQDVGEALRFAARELQLDREVAMTAISSDGLSVALVPGDVQDFEMALLAVGRDFRALQYVDQRFQGPVLEAMGFKSTGGAGGGIPQFVGGMPRLTATKGGALPTSTGMPAALAKHFLTMGLNKEATVSQIRKRYRALALEHHPDKHPEDPVKAKETFQVINDAYQAIKEAFGF